MRDHECLSLAEYKYDDDDDDGDDNDLITIMAISIINLHSPRIGHAPLVFTIPIQAGSFQVIVMEVLNIHVLYSAIMPSQPFVEDCGRHYSIVSN